jgi:hypothetical protein
VQSIFYSCTALWICDNVRLSHSWHACSKHTEPVLCCHWCTCSTIDCAQPSMNFSSLTFFRSQKIITALLSGLEAFTTWNDIFRLCCIVVCTGCSLVLNCMVLCRFLPVYLISQMCSYTIYTAKLSAVTWFQFYVPSKICCRFSFCVIICVHYIHKQQNFVVIWCGMLLHDMGWIFKGLVQVHWVFVVFISMKSGT